MTETEALINEALYGRKKGRMRVAPKEDRTTDGIVFASKKEMQRYQELKMHERIGVIHSLRLQVAFPIFVVDRGGNERKIFEYRADFVYCDQQGRETIEDVKAGKFRTEMYRLKKKAVELQNGVRILET